MPSNLEGVEMNSNFRKKHPINIVMIYQRKFDLLLLYY